MKKKILIGFISNDNTESISIITKAIIEGLKNHYDFIPLYANRKIVTTKRSTINLLNIYFYVKHLFLWVFNIIKYSPYIAHYPITSFWNLEKSLSFLLVAYIFQIKTIGHLHGGGFVEFWAHLSPIRKIIALFIFNKLDVLIVLSPVWKEQVSNLLNLDQAKIYVVNNQINSNFEKAALNNNYNYRNNSILCLGVMDTKKGVFDILETAKLMNNDVDIKFILAGPERESNIYNRINEYIIKFNLEKKVCINKGVWGGDKIALFKSATALLLPSYTENFPVVIIEAAAFGLPIITTPVGATSEYFKDGVSAIYTEPGNPKQILNAVMSLHLNKEKRMSLGDEARKVYLNKLSNEISIKSLKNIYSTIIYN